MAVESKDELLARYPHHAAHEKKKDEIALLLNFSRYLFVDKRLLLMKPNDDFGEEGESEYISAYEFVSTWDGIKVEKVFEFLGLDYAGFMAEKDQMLDEIRASQGVKDE